MLTPQLEKAVSFLISRQDKDGYWRDYMLEPGRSEAWTTACVGFALFQAAGRITEVDKAAKVLLETIRPGGWGYNSTTSCDADTTSWVILFLATIRALNELDPAIILNNYITPSGRIHTFPIAKCFGSWEREHDEVAPIAGMALLSSGKFDLVQKIRHAVLNLNCWETFWWNCYSYVCAQNLEFLLLTGGIPDEVRRREASVITNLAPPTSAFDLAHRLTAATHLSVDSGEADLLNLQQADGGWMASHELLVPSQKDGSAGETHPDDRQLMSTAMSLLALIRKYRFQ